MAAKSATWSHLKSAWGNDLTLERASRSLAKTGFPVCVHTQGSLLAGLPKGSLRGRCVTLEGARGFSSWEPLLKRAKSWELGSNI